ncbi:LuxR C-terminal-related transcriptional regulator [Bradyrhizobium genosp. A]|uniref:LuxR C-terminal-related transcriptional regulator n=1 Tax=Bradyrhizobium genosp. A TaxID=83626 RepID=UPI003CECBA3A
MFECNRLVIVDRQPIVLRGLKSILGAQQDFDVVASCSDGTSCLEAIRNLTPDVALVADTLPDLTVTEILAIAKAETLPTRLVFFTESESNPDLTAATAAGACSAISKSVSPDTMLRLLRLSTKRSVSPEHFALSPTGKEADGVGKIEKTLELLTHRERQIVRLVSEGMSNKEIARRLDVSPGTVKVHLYNIFQKLEITNRTVLATLALLRHPSGFGTLAVAFLVIAIADELKASEANDIFPDDNGIGHPGEHTGYEPWKKAILQQLIVWDSGETLALSQRDFLAKASQITTAAAALEARRAAEQSAGSKSWKHHGPVGSSTPNLPAPLLRGTSDTKIGGEPTADHQFPRLTSNPLIHAGYGTFATLAGALIYALHDPHLGVQSHDPGKASIDSFVVAAENATIKLAAITHADANHLDNPAPGFPSHDFRPPSGNVTTGNESVAGEDAPSQKSHDAEGDALQKPVRLVDAGHDASVGGYSRDQLLGGKDDKNVHRSATDSNTSSHSAFDFASGSSRINLATLGALAWLHMTVASKSIPPHTLAWIYNSASNETIVYVNPTDHVLGIGDRDLLEVHLQGIVSVAELEFVDQREGAAVAITFEKLEEALTSASTIDETAPSKDNVQASIEASESALGTAGVWAILADDGLSFQFGQTRTGSEAPTRFRTSTGESADKTEESDGASAVSAHASSIEPARSATATAVENVPLKSGPVNADTGVSSPGPKEIVQPSVAMAASADHGHSQHASEPGSAKAAATESTEADSEPDNGVGNGAEHHAPASDAARESAMTGEPGGAEHGKSGHSTAANAPDAAEIDPGVATAASADHGHSQHASEPGSAKAAATESTEADSKLGNGAGNGAEHHAPASDAARESAKTGEPGGAEHGKSGHSTAANAPDATEIDPVVATAASADHGNSQHISEPGSAKAAATESTEAGVKPDNGVGNTAEHHAPASDAAGAAAKTAEPALADHGKSQHASESGSGTAAATELTEAGVKPDNGGGNGAEHHAPASDAAGAAAKPAEPALADQGKSGHSTAANAPDAAVIDPTVAMAAGADHGNSQHASEPGPGTAATTESTEAGVKPDNGGGNGAEHHAPASDAAGESATTGEPALADQGKSGHSTAANAPDAAEIDPGVAMAAGADHGNSQHAAEPGPGTAATTESTEAGVKPANGGGNGAEYHAPASDAAGESAKTAEPIAVEPGNSELHSASANAPQAAEIIEPSVATGGNAGRGNSQHAAQSAAIASEDAQPAKAAFETGGADQEPAFRFDSGVTPSTLVAVVELKDLNDPLDPHVPLGLAEDLAMIVKMGLNTLDEHAANYGNSGPHHATVPAPHDFLI